MAQHLRLSVARKIKLLIFTLILGILFHNLNVNVSIFSTQFDNIFVTLILYAIAHPYQAEYESSNLLPI